MIQLKLRRSKYSFNDILANDKTHRSYSILSTRHMQITYCCRASYWKTFGLIVQEIK